MARYFFQAEWRGALVTDDFGEEFRTLDEAEAHAAVIAHELGRNCPSGIPVFVLSEDGKVLARCGAASIPRNDAVQLPEP
jgi:hypothetical protein